MIRLPHIRGVLLDIEGTTSSIRFVYEVMFPYVLEQVGAYLEQNWNSHSLNACIDRLAIDAGQVDRQTWLGSAPESEQQRCVHQTVIALMECDAKVTGLKQLQGLVWEAGFKSGKLVGHLFDEVGHCLRNWAADGIDLRIYSSGSIAAQKLYFEHSTAGNLLASLRGHYDTTVGSKQSTESYQRIASDFGFPPEEILFISDVPAELKAAQMAGLQTVLSIRPGNKPVPDDHGFASVTDFRQILME